MTQHPNDLDAVRLALTPLEDAARGLRWAEERPWTVQSHVWDDVGVVTVDLHDLNASVTKSLLKAIVPIAPNLVAGGVVFVTGQGRHSMGLPVLRQVVMGTLVRFERDYGWRQRDIGPGRVLLVVNEDRIPSRYREGTPLWVVAFFVAFMAAMAWALPLAIGGPLLLVAAWFVWTVRKSSAPKTSVLTLEE